MVAHCSFSTHIAGCGYDGAYYEYWPMRMIVLISPECIVCRPKPGCKRRGSLRSPAAPGPDDMPACSASSNRFVGVGHLDVALGGSTMEHGTGGRGKGNLYFMCCRYACVPLNVLACACMCVCVCVSACVCVCVCVCVSVNREPCFQWLSHQVLDHGAISTV